jgi:hypothetical protein
LPDFRTIKLNMEIQKLPIDVTYLRELFLNLEMKTEINMMEFCVADMFHHNCETSTWVRIS